MFYRTSWTGLARHKTSTYTGQHMLTYIHAPSGIWNHDPSIRADKDTTCLRSPGHWTLQSVVYSNNILKLAAVFYLILLMPVSAFFNCPDLKIYNIGLYRVTQEERSILWEVVVLVILSKNCICLCMCPIPNGFRDRAISLYSSKIVDKEEICRGADKSLAFPISPTFILIILLSHQRLLFCICLT
jgi:hypothetical protein